MTREFKWCIAMILAIVFCIVSVVVLLNARRERGVENIYNISFSADELVYKDLCSSNILFYPDGNGMNIHTTNHKEQLLAKTFLEILGVPYDIREYDVATLGYDGVRKDFIIRQSNPHNYYKDDFVLRIDGSLGNSYISLYIFDCRDEKNISEAGSITIRYIYDPVIVSVTIKDDNLRKEFEYKLAEESNLHPESLLYDEEKGIHYLPVFE